MKKLLIAIAVVAVVFGAGLGVASVVNAQAGTPPTVDGTAIPYGGMMGSNWGGHMGMMGGTAAGETGLLHDLMIAAWAEKLGLTVDELNAKIAEGEGCSQSRQQQTG